MIFFLISEVQALRNVQMDERKLLQHWTGTLITQRPLLGLKVTQGLINTILCPFCISKVVQTTLMDLQRTWLKTSWNNHYPAHNMIGKNQSRVGKGVRPSCLLVPRPEVMGVRGLPLTSSLARGTDHAGSLYFRDHSGLPSGFEQIWTAGDQWYLPGMANSQGWSFFLWSICRASSFNASPSASPQKNTPSASASNTVV